MNPASGIDVRQSSQRSVCGEHGGAEEGGDGRRLTMKAFIGRLGCRGARRGDWLVANGCRARNRDETFSILAMAEGWEWEWVEG